jgi:serine-protein kinase ATM
MALYATPIDILKLLLLCTNGTFHVCFVGRPIVLSSVFMVEYELQRNAGLSRYLIQGQNLTKPRREAPSEADAFEDNDQRARDTNNDRAVLEILLMKLQSFREAWITLSKERASNVNADVVQIMISLIIISSLIPKLLGTEGSQLCKELQTSARQTWVLLYSFIERSEEIGSVNATVVAAAVLAVRGSETVSVEDPVVEGLSFMLPPLLVQLRRIGHMTEGRENDDMDMVDVGDSFASQNSQTSSDAISSYWSRKDFPFPTNQHYFQRELMLQLRIFLSGAEAARLTEELDVPPIVDVIIDLTAEDLLNSRSSILMFLRSFTLSTSNTCRLLKRIAEACIQEYDFERCEASLCLCLEVMTALAQFWVNGEDDELHDVASDMYEWFIKVLLNKGLASTQVLIPDCAQFGSDLQQRVSSVQSHKPV